MPTRIGWGAVILGVVLVGSVGPGVARASEGRGDPSETTRAMHDIFAAFTTLVAASQDEAVFTDPDERASLEAAFRTLSDRVARLDGHDDGLNPTHSRVRVSLATDVREAQDAFRGGHFESARFLVVQMAEDCFACHSKLPVARRFDLGAEFLERPAVKALPLERRAMLAVAARQFDAALGLHEELLRSPALSPVQMDAMGVFENYLKLAIRVLDDLQRPIAALAAVRARDDVPRYLEVRLALWGETLAALAPEEGPALSRARRWVAAGRERTDFPGDSHGLVHFTIASRILHRYVDARPDDPIALSEAFYLLGLCEAHISHSLWVSETDYFLESAIRIAPGSEWARRAYEVLEEIFLLDFTGSAGTQLPPDVERRLADLRKLADGSEL